MYARLWERAREHGLKVGLALVDGDGAPLGRTPGFEPGREIGRKQLIVGGHVLTENEPDTVSLDTMARKLVHTLGLR